MNTFTKQYDIAKNNAKQYMQNGQISAYLQSLVEMNKYKKLMVTVIAN